MSWFYKRRERGVCYTLINALQLLLLQICRSSSWYSFYISRPTLLSLILAYIPITIPRHLFLYKSWYHFLLLLWLCLCWSSMYEKIWTKMMALRPGWTMRMIIVIIITAIFFRCVAATNHSVGGDSGWDLNSNILAWSAATTFQVGDYLGSFISPSKTSSIKFAVCCIHQSLQISVRLPLWIVCLVPISDYWFLYYNL